MKKLLFLIISVTTGLVFNFFHMVAALAEPQLKGPYLGQTPPGETPELFAPGVVCTDANEGCVSFSRDGNLFLFTRGGDLNPGIMMMEQTDGIWTQPKLASFSAGKTDWDFMLAPDDSTVFVSSGRPEKNGEEPLRNYRIWVSQRTGNKWSVPRMLPAPVNSGQHDSYPAITSDGTLYFFSRRSGGMGEGDIYMARRINGKYPEVKNLGTPINTEYHEVDPYISPDESYMIFCSMKPGGYGHADIYITYRQPDGSWSDPKNMGDKINSKYAEYIPYVSPDGKYFFFTTNKSGQRDIYWMSSGIIRKLR